LLRPVFSYVVIVTIITGKKMQAPGPVVYVFIVAVFADGEGRFFGIVLKS
jgi:hypothetical protein